MIIDVVTLLSVLSALGALIGWLISKNNESTREKIELESRIRNIEKDISVNGVHDAYRDKSFTDLKSKNERLEERLKELENKSR